MCGRADLMANGRMNARLGLGCGEPRVWEQQRRCAIAQGLVNADILTECAIWPEKLVFLSTQEILQSACPFLGEFVYIKTIKPPIELVNECTAKIAPMKFKDVPLAEAIAMEKQIAQLDKERALRDLQERAAAIVVGVVVFADELGHEPAANDCRLVARCCRICSRTQSRNCDCR